MYKYFIKFLMASLNIHLVILMVAFITFSCTSSPEGESSESGEDNNYKTIKSEEVKDILTEQENVVILDVRTPQEYSSGHLAGAKLINFYSPEFAQQIDQLDRDATYILYCAVGGRSREALRLMKDMQFKQVYDATEGFHTLKRNGLAVE